MKYYKIISGIYILSIIQTNSNAITAEEVTKAEYDEIKSVVDEKPPAREGYDYKLKTDLTWEEYKLPDNPEPEYTVEDKAEAYDILTGVSE